MTCFSTSANTCFSAKHISPERLQRHTFQHLEKVRNNFQSRNLGAKEKYSILELALISTSKEASIREMRDTFTKYSDNEKLDNYTVTNVLIFFSFKLTCAFQLSLTIMKLIMELE